MANNFPSVPTDLQLVSVAYTVNVADTGVIGATSGIKFTGVQTTIGTPSGTGWPDMLFTFSFAFTTPGDVGSFDQDAAETTLTSVLNSLCQAISDTTGETLAQVQALITATRLFTYQDAAGAVLTIPQPMTL